MTTREVFSGAAALLLLTAPACSSRSATVAAADGSAVPWALGVEVVAQACANCHAGGDPMGAVIPVIAGRSEAVLAAQLRAFKRDDTPGATVMPRLVKGFGDEELDLLARYFALQAAASEGD